MNQTLPTADLNTAGTTDVIPSVAIDRIIAQRNEGIALFMQAMECLATARRILLDASGDIFLYGFEDCVTDSVRCMDKPEEAKRNITRLADRKIWDRLMTDTGMYTFMSSCQRDEWNSQLMSDTCPEITLDNVLATFRHLNASKMQTFEQGLIDVYRKLSWDYCVFRSIRSRIGIEVRSAIRIHSINRELNFFYRFLTRFFAAFHYRGIFPQ